MPADRCNHNYGRSVFEDLASGQSPMLKTVFINDFSLSAERRLTRVRGDTAPPTSLPLVDFQRRFEVLWLFVAS
jgi:hypothetical protein